MNVASSYFEKIVIPLGKGPVTQTIHKSGYGFAITNCDDQSTIIRLDSPTADPYSVAAIRKMTFPEKFHTIYVTNFEDMSLEKDANLTMIIFKSKDVELDPITGFREVANALFYGQMLMLMASGATSRYKIWQVDASQSTPSTFTDVNQPMWDLIPLVQSVQLLEKASGSAFTLSTTAVSNLESLEPIPQDPIDSKFIPEGTSIKLMGYSVIYTPTVTASGTTTFLIQLQQPISMSQLKESLALHS